MVRVCARHSDFSLAASAKRFTKLFERCNKQIGKLAKQDPGVEDDPGWSQQRTYSDDGLAGRQARVQATEDAYFAVLHKVQTSMDKLANAAVAHRQAKFSLIQYEKAINVQDKGKEMEMDAKRHLAETRRQVEAVRLGLIEFTEVEPREASGNSIDIL